MRVWLAAISVLAVIVCAEATAQTWSADVVARQCTSEGAFGQRFGARANGRTGRLPPPLSQYDRSVAPPVRFEPFDRFEVKVTPRESLVAQITAMATFRSEAEALSAYTALVAAYNRGGRFPFQHEELIVRPGGPEGVAFATEEADARLTAVVARSGRTIYLLCADDPMLDQFFDEAFGRTER
jgi:hypothetical protein